MKICKHTVDLIHPAVASIHIIIDRYVQICTGLHSYTTAITRVKSHPLNGTASHSVRQHISPYKSYGQPPPPNVPTPEIRPYDQGLIIGPLIRPYSTHISGGVFWGGGGVG